MRLGALAVSRPLAAVAAGAGAPRLGTFEAGEQSGATGCGGRTRYKEGKHGGGSLRRWRRRGKRLRGDHGGGGSRAVTSSPSCYRIGPEAVKRCAPLSGRSGSPGLDNSAEESEARKDRGPELGPGSGPCGRPRGPATASGGSEAQEFSACGRPPALAPACPGPLPGRLQRGLCPGPRAAR